MGTVISLHDYKRSRVGDVIPLGKTPGLQKVSMAGVICSRLGDEFFLTHSSGRMESLGHFPYADPEWKYGPYGLVFTSDKSFFSRVRPGSNFPEYIGGFEHDGDFALDVRGVIFKVDDVYYLIELK